MSNDCVIVVGAGPVGLTAALALGRRGIPTVLVTAEPELVMELRGSTFHPPTLDLLDEFGVVPRMIDVGLKAPTWQFRDRETGPVATFDLSMLAGDTNHPYRVQCEQWKLMRFLEEELRKLPGSDIRFGHEVTSVRPDDESVTVTAETSSGPVSLTGRYVIAADGARSAVRRSLAVDFEGFTYPELFLIASTDFRFEPSSPTSPTSITSPIRSNGWSCSGSPSSGAFWCRRRKIQTGRICCRMTRCSRCCNAWSRGPSRTGSPIAPSIMCISGWRSASVTAAFCSPATPLTSTIRSAEWA